MTDLVLYGARVVVACLTILFVAGWIIERRDTQWGEAEHDRVAAEFGVEPYMRDCRCDHCLDAIELVDLDRWFASLHATARPVEGERG